MSEYSDPATDEPDRGKPGSAGSGERVIYRDDEAFTKALDAAAQSIRKAEGPHVVGNIVWWGLLALLAFLCTARWTIGRDIRNELLPGLDLTKPLWIVVAGCTTAPKVEDRAFYATSARLARTWFERIVPGLRGQIDRSDGGRQHRARLRAL